MADDQLRRLVAKYNFSSVDDDDLNEVLRSDSSDFGLEEEEEDAFDATSAITHSTLPGISSPGYPEASSVAESDTLPPTPSTLGESFVRPARTSRARPARTTQLVMAPGDGAALRERIAALEHENEVLALEARRAAETAARETKAARDAARTAAEEVRTRQARLLAEVPALREKLAAEKAHFASVEVSEALYHDLAAVPEEQRSLREHVCVRAFEAIAPHRSRAEALQREVEALREQVGRASRDAERAEREGAAALAAERERREEAERRAEGLDAHVSELQKRLAAAEAEVARTEGERERFADVLNRCEEAERALDRERHHAAVTAASLEAERAARKEAAAEAAHEREAGTLLRKDKAFLESRVTSEADARRRAEQAVEKLEAGAEDLRRAKEALQDRLVASREQLRSAFESRLQQEVHRLQQSSAAQLSEIRASSHDVYSRENAALREARDDARAALERCELKLRDAEREAEAARAARHETEVQRDEAVVDLRAQVRMKAFELERALAALDEAKAALATEKRQCEAAREKVTLLRAEYGALETRTGAELAGVRAREEAARERLKTYEALEEELDRAVMEAGAAGAEDEAHSEDAVRRAAAAAHGMPVTTQHRIRQAVSMARDLTRAEARVRTLEAEAAAAREAAAEAEARAAAAEERAGQAAQPQGYLIDALRARDAEVRALQARAEAAEAARAKEVEAHRRTRTALAEIERDLQALLQQRKGVEAMRGMIEKLDREQAVRSATAAYSRPKLVEIGGMNNNGGTAVHLATPGKRPPGGRGTGTPGWHTSEAPSLGSV